MNSIVAVINLDFIEPGNFSHIELYSVGLFRRFSPLWLRQLSIEAVTNLGLKVADFNLVDEYTYQYVELLI